MESGKTKGFRAAIGRRVGVAALTAGLLLGALGGAGASASNGSASGLGDQSSLERYNPKKKCKGKKGKAKKACLKKGKKGKGGKKGGPR